MPHLLLLHHHHHHQLERPRLDTHQSRSPRPRPRSARPDTSRTLYQARRPGASSHTTSIHLPPARPARPVVYKTGLQRRSTDPGTRPPRFRKPPGSPGRIQQSYSILSVATYKPDPCSTPPKPSRLHFRHASHQARATTQIKVLLQTPATIWLRTIASPPTDPPSPTAEAFSV